MAKC